MKTPTLHKVILGMILSIVLLSTFCCQKEDLGLLSKKGSVVENNYRIFNSDSLSVVGKIIGDPPDRYLYPNRPDEVLKDQRVLFFRQGDSGSGLFSGEYPY